MYANAKYRHPCIASVILKCCITIGAFLSSARVFGEIYLSDEAWRNTPTGRTATATLDDYWRTLVLSSHPNASFERPDNLADEGVSAIPAASGILEFPVANLYVSYSVRSMDGPLLGSLEANVLPAYNADHLNEPSTYSPVAEDLIGTGVGGADYTTFFSGSQNVDARSALLFEFSRPVKHFGLFLGDVESRPDGALAEAQLFSADNTLLNAGNTALIPTGNVIGDFAYTYDVYSDRPDRDAEGRWGNSTTQFYGFVDEMPVSKMLLIVGDEDFGDQGLTEHLVFFGATAVVPEPATACLFYAAVSALFFCLRRTRCQPPGLSASTNVLVLNRGRNPPPSFLHGMPKMT